MEAPAIHGQVLCELPVNHRANRRVLCVYQLSTTLDGDALGDRANLQPEVLLDVILHIDNQAKQIDLLKSLFLDADLVLPRMNAWKNIDANIVRAGRCDRPTLHTFKAYLDSGHRGSGPICDQPRNRSGLRLSHHSTGKPHGDE